MKPHALPYDFPQESSLGSTLELTLEACRLDCGVLGPMEVAIVIGVSPQIVALPESIDRKPLPSISSVKSVASLYKEDDASHQGSAVQSSVRDRDNLKRKPLKQGSVHQYLASLPFCHMSAIAVTRADRISPLSSTAVCVNIWLLLLER